MADLLSARQKGVILENRAIAETRASRMRDNKADKIMIDERGYRMTNQSKKIANMAMLVAVAMIFSYVESLIPINFGVPGMKLGIANLVTVTGLYFLAVPEVMAIVVMRVLLTGFLFGNGMSIIYSLAGGLLSVLVMAGMKKLKGFSIIGISMAGGIAHNIGQLAVAALVVESLKLVYYLPALLAAGAVTGFLIGLVSGKLIPVVKREAVKSLKTV